MGHRAWQEMGDGLELTWSGTTRLCSWLVTAVAPGSVTAVGTATTSTPLPSTTTQRTPQAHIAHCDQASAALLIAGFPPSRAPKAQDQVFTATPNDDSATAAMTTNWGQLPTPNSVIGAATLTTARRGTLCEALRAVGGKPTRTAGA
jgi:hypothetical protein